MEHIRLAEAQMTSSSCTSAFRGLNLIHLYFLNLNLLSAGVFVVVPEGSLELLEVALVGVGLEVELDGGVGKRGAIVVVVTKIGAMICWLSG